jgi:NodT family efflux transporter outer membrane factor (OMF) lipoprotein
VKSLIIMVGTVVLTACAALPKEDKNVGARLGVVNNYATAQSFAAPVGQWPTDAWWKSYGDAQLDELVEEALAGSPTLAIADARLRRARALSDATASAGRLQASANASATEQKQSYNYMSPPGFTPHGWNDYGRATLDFSLDLDLWGRNRKALAAAISETEATRADAAQARLTLATAIASAYAELAREYAALDTATLARDVRDKTADLFRRRFDNGLETLGSVRQVESRRAGAEAEVLGIEEQLSLQKNRIASLIGAGPDRGLALTRPAIDLARDFALPENLAANLLGRRPDLVAARLRAEAAASRVGQARAAFYPNINLNAFIGVQSLSIDMLTKNGSSIGNVGPAISLPIFSGGRLRAQLRSADAEYLEAVASYDRTLIAALQEVADVATSERALGPQLARTSQSVAAAREAWRVQSNRYEGGLATYLEVLSAEDYLLSVLRTQTDMQSRSLSLGIALVRALGGGYANQLL